MTPIYSSTATKKLVLKFILDNIDYRKKCLYLQEIISLGRAHDVWRKVLSSFLKTPAMDLSMKSFSKN